jgi:hypothetical protein
LVLGFEVKCLFAACQCLDENLYKTNKQKLQVSGSLVVQQSSLCKLGDPRCTTHQNTFRFFMSANTYLHIEC